MEKPKIKINVVLPRQTLEDIFVTALEGGSNYWYYISDNAVKKVRSVVPSSDTPALSEAIFKAVYDLGIDIPIRDAEDPTEILGTLSNKTIQQRIQKMVEDGHSDALIAEIKGDGDAITSDTIFQYLTMGTILFG